MCTTIDKSGKAKKKPQFNHLSWSEIDEKDNDYINKIVSKMETLLKVPEDILVKQN